MTRQPHRPVQEQLVDWAESSRPLPSPELARFLGPLRPVPAVASTRPWRTAVRTGLGLKVVALFAGLAVTSAAAVGIAQVALREPEPRAPVIAPVDPGEGSSPGAADPSGSSPAGAGESATPAATPSTTTRATDGPRAVVPSSPRPRVSRTPTPSSSRRSESPSPEPSDPSTEPSDGSSDSGSPEPTDTADSATPTSEDPSAGSTNG